MKKSTSAKVSRLADGIDGLYRTKRYRFRRILTAVPAVVLVAALLIGGLYAVFAAPPPSWDGELIVLCNSAGLLDRYLFHNSFGYPELLSSFSMTEEEFREQAGVVSISGAKYKSALTEKGILEQIDQEAVQAINWKSPSSFYLILVDGDGAVIYQGTYGSAVVDILKAHGFSAGG